MHAVIDDMKARLSTTNNQYIATLLSCTSTKEDAMQGWIEIIINKLWDVSWVKDEDTQSVMKHPSSANLYTKTVNNTLFVLEDMVVKKLSDPMSVKFGAIIHHGCISDGIHYLGVFAYYEPEKGNNVS